ncbi:MAG: hypothetical protein ACW98Y_10860 [Candidatus Thorarchaeota archaeon]|jgi:hypothetical protein
MFIKRKLYQSSTLKEETYDDVPISWLCKSKTLRDFLGNFSSEPDSKVELMIADFAAGETDEVPQFVHRRIQSCMKVAESISMKVYCTDLHTLRIESLFYRLEEEALVEDTRIVLSKFETMTEEASFPEVQKVFFEQEAPTMTYIDDYINSNSALPHSCFDIGVLNNDVIGYIHDYYREYTDAKKSLEGIRRVMKPHSLLIVTQPGLIFHMDNIDALSKHGFHFIEGFDIETENGRLTSIDEKSDPMSMGNLGHYTVLIFETRDS